VEDAAQPAAGWRRRLTRRGLGGPLWRHPDFLKLWAGQSVSLFGTAITFLAVPTAAIKLLHAGPVEVGLLGTFQFLAFPTLGLIAGVWADRVRRRPTMIVCDAIRLLTLGSIPLAWFAGVLTIWQLYAVALVTGVATVFFDVSYQSYLPSLIERDNLLEGNSKLEVTRAVSGVAGPGFAGVLIQLFQAAYAILVDSASYLVSLLMLLWIRKPEPEPSPGSGRAGFFREMGEGIRVVFGHPVIRLIAAATATSNLAGGISIAVFLLWVYQGVHLSPTQVGLIFSLGAIGGVVGALIGSPIGRRFGMGPTLAVSIGLTTIPLFFYPTVGASAVALPGLAALNFVTQAMNPIYNINQVSYRQAVIPVALQGRMNATVRTLIWGTIPLGALIGGVLGRAIGLVPTIYVSATVGVLAVLWILAGPVRIRNQATPEPSKGPP
jgi:MFS family permease